MLFVHRTTLTPLTAHRHEHLVCCSTRTSSLFRYWNFAPSYSNFMIWKVSVSVAVGWQLSKVCAQHPPPAKERPTMIKGSSSGSGSIQSPEAIELA